MQTLRSEPLLLLPGAVLSELGSPPPCVPARTAAVPHQDRGYSLEVLFPATAGLEPLSGPPAAHSRSRRAPYSVLSLRPWPFEEAITEAHLSANTGSKTEPHRDPRGVLLSETSRGLTPLDLSLGLQRHGEVQGGSPVPSPSWSAHPGPLGPSAQKTPQTGQGKGSHRSWSYLRRR